MSPTKLSNCAIADPDRMSERSSESCERHTDGMAHVGVAQCASAFQPPSASSVLPVQAVGTAQRDERELATYDLEELETCLHSPGIEDETAVWETLECGSGAVASVQLETRGITSQKKVVLQSELWCRQTIHKNTVAAKLREAGMVGAAVGLEMCHTEVTWAKCKGCGTSKRFLNRCEKFYCPECQPTLSRDRERSVGWWAARMQQPKHVVLTLKNFTRLNRRQVKWAKKCFSRLRRRRFASNWEGGFYNWEITNEGAGWHLHVHALIEAKWIDAGVLASEWSKVTRGWGRIVKVMDARRHDYLKEVTKYAVKGNQLAAWSGSQIKMFIEAFTGERTFGVFGELYGKRTEWREWIAGQRENYSRCKCGCDQFWYQTDDEYQWAQTVAGAHSPTRGPTSVPVAQLQFLAV